MTTHHGTGLPFGIDFGGSGIKGAPVDLEKGDFAEERVRIDARSTGDQTDVALDPTFARDAVAAAIGPDIVVEITDALLPVVFRSADDGTYTTLLMPVALT
jgi:DNA polymerase III sliding clamp (beta) subunit (PCNA family)